MYNEARSFLSRTVSKTRWAAKNKRDLEFAIDTEDVMLILKKQNYKCALTGWELEFTRGGDFDGKNPKGATIDRIDNSKGYSKDNVQITCVLANLIKRHLSNDKFIELCNAVTTQQKNLG